MTQKEEKKSRFGRRKFIGHVVRDDDKIDTENTRPIEKQGLLTTRGDALMTPENIPRTRRKKLNIVVVKKIDRKTNKPLHQKISWKVLKRVIENDKKERSKKIK